ncbi:hypothetical protein GGI12_003913 [Dipsacomyces acuminosporus]|nr:hypothetical protein GGI12_003913 [Dipsacomyces acuminosporus]
MSNPKESKQEQAASSAAGPSSPSASSNTSQQRAPAHGESYPWFRVLLGCTMVILCWSIGYYKENRERVDAVVKRAQDWGFDKLWQQISGVSAKRIHPYRKELWSEVHGNVLEIGSGYGEAFSLLPRAKSNEQAVDSGRILKYIALEPNAFLHQKLDDNAQSNGFLVQYDKHTCPDATVTSSDKAAKAGPLLTIVNGTLDDPLSIPKYIQSNAPYDYILSSLVLCSVDDVKTNLQSIYQLLKPGGKFIFIEHIRHSSSSAKTGANPEFNIDMWRKIQDVLTPVWSIFSGSCHLDRQTDVLLKEVGWKSIEFKSVVRSDSILEKLTPLIYGVAKK